MNGAIFQLSSNVVGQATDDTLSVNTEHHTCTTVCSSPECSDAENSDVCSSTSETSNATEISDLSVNDSCDFTYAF